MRLPLARLFPAALILLIAALPGSARLLQDSPDRNPPAHTMAKKIAISSLPNFGEITPTLFRGAQPTDEGLRKLKEMNFDVVVDFRQTHASERKIVTSLGMEYISIPWNCNHPEDEDIAQLISVIRSHPGKKIFVHCLDGVDRTGISIAAFRMIEQGWDPVEARKEMTFFGFNQFHRTICAPLVQYEANFPSRFQTRPAFAILRASSPSSADPAKK